MTQGKLLLVTVILGCLCAIALSMVTNNAMLFVWYEVVVFALFAMSTNIVVGWNGVGTFGQALYFAFGAYTVGLLDHHSVNLPPEVLLLAGGCVAAAVGLFYGLIAVRTGAFAAMAMLTLMFAQAGYQLLYGVSFFGGADGLVGLHRGNFFGLSLVGNRAFDWYLVAVTAVCWYVLARFRRSTVVHAMFAAKNDPIRAAAAGLSVRGLQRLGFVTGAFFAGIAGGLYAQVEGTISPDIAFWTISGTVLMMVILGGTRYLWGPPVGALIYSWINFWLLGTTVTMNLYLGVILLFFVLFAPKGVSYFLVVTYRKVVAGVNKGKRKMTL